MSLVKKGTGRRQREPPHGVPAARLPLAWRLGGPGCRGRRRRGGPAGAAAAGDGGAEGEQGTRRSAHRPWAQRPRPPSPGSAATSGWSACVPCSARRSWRCRSSPAVDAAELQPGARRERAEQRGATRWRRTTWFPRSARVRDVRASRRRLRGAEVARHRRAAEPERGATAVRRRRSLGRPAARSRQEPCPAASCRWSCSRRRRSTPRQPLAGLLIDEWVEVVPSATETTGITFQYDQPDACPPQTILLAVPPEVGVPWTWSLQRCCGNARPGETARRRSRCPGRGRRIICRRSYFALNANGRHGLDRLRAADADEVMASTPARAAPSHRPRTIRRMAAAAAAATGFARASASRSRAAGAAADPAPEPQPQPPLDRVRSDAIDHELDAARAALPRRRHAQQLAARACSIRCGC